VRKLQRDVDSKRRVLRRLNHDSEAMKKKLKALEAENTKLSSQVTHVMEFYEYQRNKVLRRTENGRFVAVHRRNELERGGLD
jgi:c-di-AMP phosphodiesterase-like protein